MTRPAPPGRSADRAVPSLRRLVGATLGAGALLAVLGPFGSYLNGGPIRLAVYWVGAMLLGLILYGSAYKIVSTSVARAWNGWWLALIAATLVASVPEAWATREAAFWLWPDLKRLHLPVTRWFAQTTMLGLIAMAGVGVATRRAAWASNRTSPPSPPVTPTVRLGGDVLALQMEDHYVRVHRRTGSELILMPLGRAIQGVQANGLRTHRSWWVADHAVIAVEGNARSMRLRLANGLVAPVARSAVTHLKVAGWIADTGAARDRASA